MKKNTTEKETQMSYFEIPYGLYEDFSLKLTREKNEAKRNGVKLNLRMKMEELIHQYTYGGNENQVYVKQNEKSLIDHLPTKLKKDFLAKYDGDSESAEASIIDLIKQYTYSKQENNDEIITQDEAPIDTSESNKRAVKMNFNISK